MSPAPRVETRGKAAFQSVADHPVLVPESFRGGCSFGADEAWAPAVSPGGRMKAPQDAAFQPDRDENPA